MRRTVGVCGSIAVHTIVILALLEATREGPKPPPKSVPVAIRQHDTGRLSGDDEVGAGLACAGYHYNGIGIMLAAGGRVIDVGAGTPAARAGLVDGDVLIDPEQLAPDRYPPGTLVVLRVARAGRELAITIRIGRICNAD